MRNKTKNSVTENLHPLVEYTFMDYANRLRAAYPAQTIRNGAVFKSAVSELERRGFIELVDARKGIPAHVSDDVAQRVKRMKYQPVWIASRKFPDLASDILELVKPYMRGNKIAWKYDPHAPRTSLRW